MTVIDELKALLPAGVVHTSPDDLARHLADYTVTADGAPLLAVAYPRSTSEVADILRFCNAHAITVTPQGGLTGMAGGAVPVGPGVAVCLDRMRAIEELDADACTITVQAGVVLESVQKAADEAGFFFPLDLGGRGSAQVGGNASTNAGGNRVLRYGMMRDLILGAEVVLADGTVISALNKMMKNNSGYDLKHLFIGAEGTLGIITRLVLKLHPKPAGVCTALAGLADYDAVLALLRRAREGLGGGLSAFEVMWPEFYHLGATALGRTPPIEPIHGLYALVEMLGADPAGDQARFEALFEQAIGDGIVADAVIAQSGKEAAAIWAIRDSPGEWPKVHWPQLAFDVSIPTGRIGAFRIACERRLRASWPELTAVFFGHVADSNLHISILLDAKAGSEQALDEAVYELVGEWGGSISAEHGIGTHKKPYLHYSRSPEEIALMRTLKAALDPNNILNPGKIF